MFRKIMSVGLILSVCFTLSACGKSVDDSKEAVFSVEKTAWISQNDNSYLEFLNAEDWVWRKDREIEDDNYFSGTYQFYQGEAALNYITNDLKEYGYTSEELYDVFSRNEMYDLSNLVCMTLLHKSFVSEGTEMLEEDTPKSYFGFILKDNTYLDIANMQTETYYGFEIIEP